MDTWTLISGQKHVQAFKNVTKYYTCTRINVRHFQPSSGNKFEAELESFGRPVLQAYGLIVITV